MDTITPLRQKYPGAIVSLLYLSEVLYYLNTNVTGTEY